MKKFVGFLVLILIGTMFSFSANAGTVKLQWGASDGATGYKVYVDDKQDTTVVISGLTATATVVNGYHKFNVTAFNERGESPFSNSVYTPALAVAPLNLKASISGNIATYTWDTVASAFEYRLYVNGVLNKTIAAGTTTASIDIGSGSASACVMAYNAWGESPASNTVFIATVPASPVNIEVIISIGGVQ